MLISAAAAVISPAPCKDQTFRPAFNQRAAARCVLGDQALKRCRWSGDSWLFAFLEPLSIVPWLVRQFVRIGKTYQIRKAASAPARPIADSNALIWGAGSRAGARPEAHSDSPFCNSADNRRKTSRWLSFERSERRQIWKGQCARDAA